MKVRLDRESLATGLAQVQNVVGARASMPILSHVLLETSEAGADEGSLSLTTTNLDLGIRCKVQATVETEGGITLPVRKLSSIVKKLPNPEVVIELVGEGRCKVSSGGSVFQIMGLEKTEFPPLPTFENQHTFVLQQTRLQSLLKNVSYAQSSDENRYILNGVYFNFSSEGLTLVATDGRRLALMKEGLEDTAPSEGNLILPAKTVSELERLLGQGDAVNIAFNDRQVVFEIGLSDSVQEGGLRGSIYLVSKIVEGTYPNYKQVIPNQTEHRIEVERELMLECIERAALMTSDKSSSVRFKMAENRMEITGSSPEYGESHESMAIDYEGPEVQVAFNPQFLIEPLRALTLDSIVFEFKDELSPGLVRTADSFLCVVMPLRLS